MALRTALIAFVLLASGLALVVSSAYASAASGRTNLIIGLQNDMVNVNPFDPGTNSVWKAYQTQYNFETLFTFDPDSLLYADLADPAAACPAGTTIAVPGSCIDSAATNPNLNITVNIRQGVTFTNGATLNADDVVFTYQHLAWSTYATSVASAIWWDAPIAPLWNSTAYGGSCASALCVSHVGVFKTGPYQVRFQLTPHSVPGVTNGGYALVFYDTLNMFIIPRGVWSGHLNSDAPLNYSDPLLGEVTDSWDRSIDFAYGANAGQKDATVGTGPFMMVSWTRNAGSKSVVYPNYWGKNQAHTWGGASYKFFPAYVTELDFIVYGSLDVVSLALQQGSIDTLLWSLTPGFVNVVSSNPAITIQTVTDSGYFYMSFNMREEPWKDKCLREAISMAIDKNYIANTLMGGYGIPGFAPIAIGNPTYVNSSAVPPPFNLAGIQAKLTGCGYTIDPATGFFRAPASHGGQVVKTTILTPPKDYDPVRADAGIMISNNLKAAKLDIDAAPTSFDTIVAKAFTRPVNFDIYVLGWSLGAFPETYICTFFCSSYDVNKNPAGSNSAGYSNPVVDDLINQALYTTDTNARKAIIKHVEGLVAADIPWNVLYYRKNVVAWRNDAWSGWVLYPNGNAQFNYYSVVSIQPAASKSSGGGFVGPLAVATSIPDQVYYREVVPISVYVSQNGAPVSGAAVSLTLQFGTLSVSFSGTTNANGKYTTSWTVPLIQGSGTAAATATYQSLTATNTKTIESTIGPPMPSAQLRLSSPTPVIVSGTPAPTATITATVTNSAGVGIANVPISLETNITAGSVSPLAATTDASGVATFTYTSPDPSVFVNSQFTDFIRARVNVTQTIATSTQTAQMVIVTENRAAPQWNIVSLAGPILGTEFTVIGATPNTVAVSVRDFTGTAVAGAVVESVYSDSANFTVTPTATTDATGVASFTVSATPAAVTGQNATMMPLTFQVSGAVFGTSDTVLMQLATVTSTGYGGYVSIDARAMPYSPTRASNNVSVHLFNKTGAPVAGVPAMFKIDYGDFGLPAQFPMAIDYDCPSTCPTYTQAGGGLDLNSFGQGSLGGSFQSSVGQGFNFGVENFVNDAEVVGWDNNFVVAGQLDACDPASSPNPAWDGSYIINVTSATDATGAYSVPFSIEQEKKDSRIQIQAFIGSAGGTAGISANACAFSATIDNFAHQIGTGLVTQRAPIFALSHVVTLGPTRVANVFPPMPIVTSQSRVVQLAAQFKDANGVVSNPVVLLTQGDGSAGRNVLGTFGGTQAGTAAGWLNYSRTVCASNSACSATSASLSLSQGLTFTYLPADTRYAFSGTDQLFAKAFGVYWFAPTFEALFSKLPMSFTIAYLYLPTSTAFLKVAGSNDLVSSGGTSRATVTAYSSLTGNTIPGANVWIGNQQQITNETGVATFDLTATAMGAQEHLVVATTPYGGVARGWYAFVASDPVLSYTGITVTTGAAGSASTITVTAQNTLALAGNATVWLLVNNKAVAGQIVSFGASESKSVTFTYVFASAGTYTVGVGASSTQAAIPAADLTGTYALAAGLLAAGLVVGAVVGLLMGRRRKPPTSMPGSSRGGAQKSAEEELGEDNL
jgi:ABC-type transport system substrate-binding protein